MEPGVVYTARTLAKDRVTRRGDATCYELVKSDFFVEAMSALDIHLTGSTPNKKVNKFDLLLFVKTGNGSLLVSGENIELKKRNGSSNSKWRRF